MATLHTYRCTDCGYEVRSNPAGYDTLMSGIVIDFLCGNCKRIVSIPARNLTGVEVECPECGESVVSTWNPVDGHCPRCGGDMAETGTVVLAD